MAKNTGERQFDKKLIAVYDKYGLNKFLDVSASLLNIKDTANGPKKGRVNGELCEVVLRVMTEHYLRERKIKGQVFHSLVLANKEYQRSDFRTELDFTLLTPFVCITAECKSFSGELTATDKCLLTRDPGRLKGLSADVARQTNIHTTTLLPYLQEYVRGGAQVSRPPLYPFCFLYSNGALNDTRDKSARSALPILNIMTLFKYYDMIFKKCTREVYNVQKAAKVFQRMADSEILHIQHANYLGY